MPGWETRNGPRYELGPILSELTPQVISIKLSRLNLIA
jgi:hypothetical protein